MPKLKWDTVRACVSHTYRVSHLNGASLWTQLSPKLFVIPKNVSNETYFVSRETFFDRHRSSLGRRASKISRVLFL